MLINTNRRMLRINMRALGSTEEEIERMISFLPPPPPKSKRTKPNASKGTGKTLQWLRDHVDHQGDECLIWPFSRHAQYGRGMVGSVGGQSWAHRAMCEMAHGPAPADKPQAAHNCGKGHEGCVNPRHLEWKTNSQNQIDRFRVHQNPSSRPQGRNHGFTERDVAAIRATYAAGGTTQMKLAEDYRCSLGTIQYYLKYRERRGHKPWHPEQTLGEPG